MELFTQEPFWSVLGNFVNVASLVTLLLSAYTAWSLFRQNRKLREQARLLTRPTNYQAMRAANDGIGVAPVALAFSLTQNSGSLEPAVERFLRQKSWTMPFEEIDLDGISPENIEQLVNMVREKRRLIEMRGHTDVHVFFSGPVIAGCLVGSLLDNWLPVKLYQKLQASDMYEYWSPLL